MMKINKLIFVFIFILLISYQPAFTMVTSTFDTDADGWTFSYDHSWRSTGGNPGGYIHYIDTTADAWVYAPSKFLGDWITEGATHLTYEINIFDTGSVYLVGNYQVMISGPGGTALWVGPKAYGEVGWKLLDVPILESDWTVVSGTWNALLSDVTELKIATAFYNNYMPQEINGLDNVSLDIIPAPAAILLGSIGIGAVNWFRRRKAI